MTNPAYLRPTTVQRIRAFFDGVGESVPPWTGVDEMMDGLWTVLHGRRGDEAFWKGLEELVGQLGADAALDRSDGLPDPAAEILSRERIRSVIDELHAALEASGPASGPGAMRRLLRQLSAPVAGSVILLALALAAGCRGQQAASATERLASYVDGSGLPEAQKQALRRCVEAGLTQEKKDSLVELFAKKSPEEIAAALEDLLAAGGDCGEPAAEAGEEEAPAPDAAASADAAEAAAEDAGADEGPADVQEAGPVTPRKKKPPKKNPINMTPVYKGVTL